MPLAQMTTGVPDFTCAERDVATDRRCCAGTESNRRSLPATAERSPVARGAGSSLTVGRKSGFSPRRLTASTTSASRAQSNGLRPARAATTASAVPHAPPPTTPIRSTRRAPDCRSALSISPSPAKWERGLPPLFQNLGLIESGVESRDTGLGHDIILRAGPAAYADCSDQPTTGDERITAARSDDIVEGRLIGE